MLIIGSIAGTIERCGPETVQELLKDPFTNSETSAWEVTGELINPVVTIADWKMPYCTTAVPANAEPSPCSAEPPDVAEIFKLVGLGVSTTHHRPFISAAPVAPETH